ncbi:MAG: ComEC/Rec2 family competence protein, partial [Bacteroidales bacterium]|nr:ComEC/Rec2 family competence protein [Bacteroidales bacterium]
APFVCCHFHSFPVYFLLTNLIALPLTEGLMVSAVIALLLSTTFGNDGGIAAQLTELLAEGLQRCLELTSTM